jgi:hypothetical protein
MKYVERGASLVQLHKGHSFNIKSLIFYMIVQQPNWDALKVEKCPCYINVFHRNNYDTTRWKNQYRLFNQFEGNPLDFDGADLEPYTNPVQPTVYCAKIGVSFDKFTPQYMVYDTAYRSYKASSVVIAGGSAVDVNEEYYFNGRKQNKSRWSLYSHNKVVFHNPSYTSKAQYGYPVDFKVSLSPEKIVMGPFMTHITHPKINSIFISNLCIIYLLPKYLFSLLLVKIKQICTITH